MIASRETHVQEQSSVADTRLRVPCEVYSRIVGYLRPVRNWNKGKQQEHRERKPFVVEDAG